MNRNRKDCDVHVGVYLKKKNKITTGGKFLQGRVRYKTS